MSLIVKTNIKDAAQGYNVSSTFAEALEKEVEAIIKKACQRAEANGRKTVMDKDL